MIASFEILDRTGYDVSARQKLLEVVGTELDRVLGFCIASVSA